MAQFRVLLLPLAALMFFLPAPTLAQAPGITTIDCEGAVSTIVAGVNDAGRAVGFYIDRSGVAHGFITDGRHGCEALPDLPDGYMPFNLNDSEHIVGIHIVSDQQRGFVYRRGEVTDLWFPSAPGAPATCQTCVTGINNRGQVVGFYDLENSGEPCGQDHPFMWEDGAYLSLPRLPAWDDSVGAAGINPRGDIVGGWLYDPAGDQDDIDYGYLWPKDGTGVSFGFPIGSGVAKMTAPVSINARGDSVGFFYAETSPDDVPEGVLFGPCRGFFRDRDGTMTELKVPGSTYTCTLGLNAAGEISGIWTQDAGLFPASWRGFIAKKDALIVQP